MTETSKNLKKKLFFGVTKANFGGAQKYVFDLASGLKGDFDITVIAGNGGILGEKLEQNGVRTVYFPELDRDMDPCLCKETRVFFKLVSLFQKENPEILHLNSSKMGGLGNLAARFARIKKIIFTGHGWEFNAPRPWWQKLVIKFFSWLVILLSHKTICVSEKTKGDISHWPFIKGKLMVIRNGVESFDVLSRIESRAELNIQDDEFVVGALSELHPVKGLDILIEAWEMFSKTFFLKFWPRRLRSPQFSLSNIKVEKRVSGSSGSTRTPFIPVSIISGIPPTFVATTGVLARPASSTA